MPSQTALPKEEKSGFSGLRVLSFESRRAFEMESLLVRHGAKALVAPSMREIPFEVNREAIAFAEKVLAGGVDIVILLTGVGTRFLLQVIEQSYNRESFLKALATTTLVARGPKPVAVLRELGLKPTVVAPAPNTWREVLTALDGLGSVKDKKIFVQEYGIINEELIVELKARGARVIRVPVYRWALPDDISTLRKAVAEVSDGQADALLFTNATQLEHVLRVAAEEGLEASFREALDRVAVCSIGPVVTERLQDLKLPMDFQSEASVMGLFVKEASEKLPAILEKKRAAAAARRSAITVKSYPIKPVDPKPVEQSAFMKACRLEKSPFTPVWLMRQAGRYMKDYRDVRSKVSFLELCKNSDLACEVTVTAQERLKADAAIIFSDILLIADVMGVGLEYSKGDGPLIHRPVRTLADVQDLKPVDPATSLGFMMESLKKTRSALKPDVPLIGFCGAPFTVASYMVEGKRSDNYLQTKTFMYRDPEAWNALMARIAQDSAAYINAQIAAGANAVQIFDSWIGSLSPADYRAYVQPHMKKLFSQIKPGAPVIHFGTGTSGILDLMKEAGGTVIGLDWRVDLAATWERLDTTPSWSGAVRKTAIMGNLDPLVLLSDVKTVRAKAKEILDSVKGKPGHIFNLGHGILPQTPVDNVIALIDAVHEFSSK